ncbi:MAG: lytic transglycosylase domain-containing protein, partial [Rhodoferax sp.]
MTATQKFTKGLATFATDIAQGFFEITHNGFALLGLAVMFAVITLTARPEIRQASEVQLMSWLQARQNAVAGVADDVEAVDRTTATNPH